MPEHLLSNSLNKLEISYQIEENFKEELNSFIKNPISDQFLNNFSNLELSIIFLLAIGYDIISISRYKGIAEVRVRQLITSIQSSDIWSNSWLSNGLSQMMKNSA